MSSHFQVPLEKVPKSGMRTFLKIGDKTIVLFNIDTQFYAIDDSCPHQGASLYTDQLQGRSIQCCAHGLRFDVASGYLLNSTQLKVATYPVEVQGEQVFIVIDAGARHE